MKELAILIRVGDEMENSIKEYEQIHKENYCNAVKEMIRNNTKALVFDDLSVLFDKPPLDSMDLVKQKFLLIAKENHLILETQILEKQIFSFQKNMKQEVEKVGKYREEVFQKKLEKFLNSTQEVIHILKKDLLELDKQIKKKISQSLLENVQKYFLQNPQKFFKKIESQELLNLIQQEMEKFFKKKYSKDLLDKIDIKILVKDTTLLNSLKEQTNRYLFTKTNSHLFD